MIRVYTEKLGDGCIISADENYACDIVLTNPSLTEFPREYRAMKRDIKRGYLDKAGITIDNIIVIDKDGSLFWSRDSNEDRDFIFIKESKLEKGKYEGKEWERCCAYNVDPKIGIEMNGWSTVSGFRKACEMTIISMLENKDTPWNSCVDEETDDIIEYLIPLNNKGFLTIESQPGIKKIQRAYVNGFMSDEMCKKIMKLGVSFIYYNYKSGKIVRNWRCRRITSHGVIPLTYDGDEAHTVCPIKHFKEFAEGERDLCKRYPVYMDVSRANFVCIHGMKWGDNSMFIKLLECV